MITNLLHRSRAGDEVAFAQLVDPHRRELLVHCYRILGSIQDAEDALQETLLAAWRGLDAFEERASVRTWLYRVATSRCLIMLRSARRRPQTGWPPPGLDLPEPTRLHPAVWLEPCPDTLLAGLADAGDGPEARYEAKEAISLAFITALQQLSPRQRAVLVLRDVLGFPAGEAARILATTEESVTSALKRARATVGRRCPPSDEPAPLPGSTAEQHLVDQLTRAYETGNVDDLVALLTDDVVMSMPPIPLEFHGRDLVTRFLHAAVFQPDTDFSLVATRANGQPAFGVYLRNPAAPVAEANGLLVFTLAGDRISAITRFDVDVLPGFGLPPTLPIRPRRWQVTADSEAVAPRSG